MAMTEQIISAVKKNYESQGASGVDFLAIARAEIEKSLANNKPELKKAAHGPTVVSIVGVNGTGKTTTIGKLAHRLKTEGHEVTLVAADTFRAAAIEQLEAWAKRVNAPLIRQGANADPAAVVYDAIRTVKAGRTGVIIIDTAGRLHTKVNLMEELKKMKRIMGRELPGGGEDGQRPLLSGLGRGGRGEPGTRRRPGAGQPIAVRRRLDDQDPTQPCGRRRAADES